MKILNKLTHEVLLLQNDIEDQITLVEHSHKEDEGKILKEQATKKMIALAILVAEGNSKKKCNKLQQCESKLEPDITKKHDVLEKNQDSEPIEINNQILEIQESKRNNQIDSAKGKTREREA